MFLYMIGAFPKMMLLKIFLVLWAIFPYLIQIFLWRFIVQVRKRDKDLQPSYRAYLCPFKNRHSALHAREWTNSKQDDGFIRFRKTLDTQMKLLPSRTILIRPLTFGWTFYFLRQNKL